MNVRCPQCETLYRVDPSKVPERGVRARCATCASIMTVARPRQSPAGVGAPAGIGESTAPAPLKSPAAAARLVEPEVRPVVLAPEPKVEVPKPGLERLAPEPVEPEPAVTEAAIPEPVLPEPEPDIPAADLGPSVRERAVDADEPLIPTLEEPEAAEPEPAPHGPAAPVRQMPRYSRPFIQPREAPATAHREPPAAPPRPTAPVFRPTPGTPVKPPAEARPPFGGAPVEGRAQTPPAAAQPSAAERRRPINPFLSRDPSQKARRLARALVSDMIVYQPKKRQEALASGTLREAFEEEIRKSWEEYVQQVGEDTASSTDFFREALNDILAGGRTIFEAGFKF